MGVEGERELEDFLTGVFEDEPAEPRAPEGAAEAPPETQLAETVRDVPAGTEPPVEDEPVAVEEVELPEEELSPEDEEAQEIAWAKKKYGDDPEKWARAAFQQEQYISRLAGEKKQAEELARQMVEYAQSIEAQAVSSMQAEMPLTAQEQAWIEQGLSNPVNYAYTALLQGNPNLYNGLIERIAEDNPAFAANVGAQAQMAFQQAQAQAQAQAAAANTNGNQDFTTTFAGSVQRLGINLEAYGQAMSDKIGELGEYHPYVQTIMYDPDASKRDMALMAVYDLVRAGQTATKRVRETEREQQIRREGELRREAASVVTGSPHVDAPKETPLMAGMIEEWKRRGQWADDET